MPLPVCSAAQFKEKHKRTGLEAFIAEREEVCRIIETVRLRGDAALKEYTAALDGAVLDNLRVPEEELDAAEGRVAPELAETIRRAAANIERFHRRQASGSWWEAGPGTVVGQRREPLQAVGAYVPGGTASYPSSVLMTLIPARVAGVPAVYLCTPPARDGSVHPLTLAAARTAGAAAVFKAGGAQAVAALAYGTETVPAVQKIVGPGNIYVTLAKREVYGRVGIDMLAGPSEIAVVADETANPAFIAADLLSQAEHDPLAMPLLVTTAERVARAVNGALEEQLRDLPRQKTARRSLAEQGAAVLVGTLDEAWELLNETAPEHLELHLSDPWRYLDRVRNAGAVFIGAHSPEPLGDYWAGSNHVLPTGGAARYASPLSVSDFMKSTQVIYYTAEALREAAPWIERLARAEGLEAHARAVALRRRKDGAEGGD